MPDLIACRNDINHSRLTYPRPFASRYLPPFSPLPTPPGSSRETVPTEIPANPHVQGLLPSFHVCVHTSTNYESHVYACPSCVHVTGYSYI